MKHLGLLLFPPLLGGCVASAHAPSAASLDQAPYTRALETEQIEFHYSYPAAAAAIPALAERLRADEEKILKEAVTSAAEDQRSARGTDRPFHSHYLSKSWEATGQSDRLLALVAEIGAFTGGAHGNSGFATLLWDRSAGREIQLGELFGRAEALQAATRRDFCRALETERLRRRRGESLEGQFSECPAMSALAISPLDTDRDGRFDHVRFHAAPYVAGPWAEGSYVTDVPVSSALIEEITLPYRSSFEPY